MKTYTLKLTSAMVIAGGVVRAGTTVELDQATAKDFLRRGKAELISAPAEAEQPAQDDAEVDLSKLNKAQLVEVAEQLNIEGAAGMTKAELLEAIENA